MNSNQIEYLLPLRVADNISAMVSYWDLDLICRFANAELADWYGKPKEEMINAISIQDLLGPIYEKNRIHIEGALNGEVQTFQRELPLANGGIRHTLSHYYPDIIEGKVVGFFAHVADVSQLKLLEHELVAQNEKINEQNTRLMNFSNIVSHNLKSYSLNLAAILAMFGAATSDEEKDRLFHFLLRISAGFTSTVTHLNEVVQSQNMAALPPEPINLHAYIERSKDSLMLDIESTKALVLNNVSKDLTLLGNPTYMESILLNLMTNALKYRQEHLAPIIEFSSATTDGTIVVKIKDNGKGIDLKRHGGDLFKMYKTFHGNKDAEGVGLYITKFQVETMGGKIEVESEVGVGTTFSLTFGL